MYSNQEKNSQQRKSGYITMIFNYWHINGSKQLKKKEKIKVLVQFFISSLKFLSHIIQSWK
jgi:hypothetical protein